MWNKTLGIYTAMKLCVFMVTVCNKPNVKQNIVNIHGDESLRFYDYSVQQT